jgi:diadenosine tetraphosphate (Ap4A) HIT family hydrolase
MNGLFFRTKNFGKDDKMFKGLPHSLEEAQLSGIAPWANPIRDDAYVAIFSDKFPVTPGHLLFVPKYANIEILESAITDAITWGSEAVDAGEADGYNVGINIGSAAGQTIPWPHVHLIMRMVGDCDNAIGGVRNVIPGQGNYKSDSYKNPQE